VAVWWNLQVAEKDDCMIDELELSDAVEEHRKLDQKIEDAMTHPGSDEMEIAELKKRKLGLKDLISHLKADNSKVA
jgi:hypothetical protein